jgi:hypothetical protein
LGRAAVRGPGRLRRHGGRGQRTFEGTEAMQALIVGRDITGIGAFR